MKKKLDRVFAIFSIFLLHSFFLNFSRQDRDYFLRRQRKLMDAWLAAVNFLKWRHEDLNAQNIRFKTCVILMAVNYLDS